MADNHQFTKLSSLDLPFFLLSQSIVDSAENQEDHVDSLPSIYQILGDVQEKTDTSSTDESTVTKQRESSATVQINNDVKGDYDSEDYPKRIRRSKYDYISGNLSHIRREPKTTKGNGDEMKSAEHSKRKYSHDKEEHTLSKRKEVQKSNFESRSSERNEDSNSSQGCRTMKEENDEDILLVRELIKYLYYPKSKDHQNFALLVLKTDAKLMQIFHKEKMKFIRC